MTTLSIPHSIRLPKARFGRQAFLSLVLFVAAPLTASAQSYPVAWPADPAWIPYTHLATESRDLRTDAGDQTDGGTGVNPDSSDTYDGGARNNAGTLATSYFFYDSSNQVMFFRMRLLGDPRQGSAFSNGTWNAVLDTDGDGFKEFFVEVNGNNDPDFINIYYGDTNQQNIPNGFTCAGNGQGKVWTQPITLGTHVRIVVITGGGYFMDIQVPMSAFKNCSNTQVLTAATPFLITYTTSQTTQNPTQKDFVGSGDYAMAADKALPGGDPTQPGSGISQNPFVTDSSRTCGGGVNASPITLTATVLDTLSISGAGAGATIVDTIANVTFSYRLLGTVPWNQIAQVNSPVAGTLNKWTAQWNTSALAAGTYEIKVDAVDDQSNAGANTSLLIELPSCNTVTDVDLVSFSATAVGGKTVLLQWQTGFEVSNLGFNLYRDEEGRRTRINQQILAGSALLAGPDRMLTAGKSYKWRDDSAKGSPDTQYWLEDIDVNGRSVWHGPVVATDKAELDDQKNADERLSAELKSLGMDEEHSEYTTEVVQPAAEPAKATAARLTAQAALVAPGGVKLSIRKTGWYRVTAQELIAAGFDPKADPRLLQLFTGGRQIPIKVTSSTSDYVVEFFGVALESPYTDVHTYWLVAGSQQGLRVKVGQSKAAAVANGSFPYTVERKERSIYFSGLRNGEVENFFGAVVTPTDLDQSINIEYPDQSTDNRAVLEVALQGVTLLQHQVMVTLNGRELGGLSFAGQSSGVKKFTFSQSMLREGGNVVTLRAQSGDRDVSLMDYLRVTYSRTYTASKNVLRLTAPAGQEVTVGGFTSPSIQLVDVSDPDAVVELTGTVRKADGGYSITAAAPGGGQKTLFAFTEDQAAHPAVAFDYQSSLRTSANAADLVIISRREFFGSIEPLAALRRAQGLKVTIVDVDDVYDEFSFGEKTPYAVRDFLSFARSNWKMAPRYVLLAADASFDPKNYLNRGYYDLVPTKLLDTTLMETSSDDWFADFKGKGLAEMAVGRLPFRNSQEAETMISKIIRYDQSAPSESLLLVADSNDGFDFEAANAQLRRLVPESIRVEEISRSHSDPATAKQMLFEAINGGQKLINYTGHGSLNQWRGNLLTSDDANSLGNADRLPVFFMMTCLNGYFQDPTLDSLAESLLKARHGGAVAVWASSGMTQPDGQAVMNQQLYRLLLNPGRQPTLLGDAIIRAKSGVADEDVRKSWILFADPTMRLK